MRSSDPILLTGPTGAGKSHLLSRINLWSFRLPGLAVSRTAKKSSNDSDRLGKYLARFGLKFRDLH